MSLILPPHIKAKMRPLASTSTNDLLEELGHRQLVGLLSSQAAVPEEDAALPQELRTQMLNQRIAAMLQQLGLAIANTPFVLIDHRLGPPETLAVECLALRHPRHPKPAEAADELAAGNP